MNREGFSLRTEGGGKDREATEAMESQMLVTESEDFRSCVSHKRKIFLEQFVLPCRVKA